MLSVIVPIFNEADSLLIFYDKLKEELNKIKEETEILFVDDGSKDNSLPMMKELALQDPHVKYISFSRNFGKEAAMYAGLSYAKGDWITIMDADLQDPPSLLSQMYDILINGEEVQDGRRIFYDCVATRRVSRKGEPVIRSFFARSFYKLVNRMTPIEIVDGARDYRMMSRKYVNAVLAVKEYNRFSKGLFSWVGFQTKWLEFENVKRIAGETKWSFGKLLLYAIDGITAFSAAPLTLSAFMGAGLSVFAFFMLVVVVVRRIIFGDPVAGWASTVCIMIFLGGIQLLTVGILGEYLSKVYLEVKKRPLFICAEGNAELPENSEFGRN